MRQKESDGALTDNDEESSSDSAEPMMEFNPAVRRNLGFKLGDKFTKKPLQYGKWLVFLGRIHVHMFNLEDFSTRILVSIGEDQAEKVGALLRKNPELIADAVEKPVSPEDIVT